MANVPTKGQIEFNSIIGQNIAAVMEKQNLTDEQLSKMIDENRVNITRYRNGQRQCPTVVLKRIAEACNVSVDFLFGLSPVMTKNPDYQNACNLTGLNERAIQCLQQYPVCCGIDKKIINEILCNKNFYIIAKVLCATKKKKNNCVEISSAMSGQNRKE